jgi:hypothetical protein
MQQTSGVGIIGEVDVLVFWNFQYLATEFGLAKEL